MATDIYSKYNDYIAHQKMVSEEVSCIERAIDFAQDDGTPQNYIDKLLSSWREHLDYLLNLNRELSWLVSN